VQFEKADGAYEKEEMFCCPNPFARIGGEDMRKQHGGNSAQDERPGEGLRVEEKIMSQASKA